MTNPFSVRNPLRVSTEEPDLFPKNKSALALETAHRDRNCNLCPLHKNSSEKTICMFGDGPVPSKGMVIGEAPQGWDEQYNRPFVDGPKATSYLKLVLGDAGIEVSDLYMTYAAKCRTSNDSNYEAHLKLAQKACAKYLDEEIAAVKPNAVLAMGSSAYYYFTHGSGVLRHRGKAFWDPIRNLWVVPTINPSYVVKYPSYHEAFISDVQKFKRLMDGKSLEPKVQIREIRTFDDFLEMKQECEEAKGIITFDLETKGFIDYLPSSRVWCAAISTGKKVEDDAIVSWLLPLEHPDSPFLHTPSELMKIVDMFTEIILSKKVSGHNVKFDMRWIYRLKERYSSTTEDKVSEWCEDILSGKHWDPENIVKIKSTRGRKKSVKPTKAQRLASLIARAEEKLAVEAAKDIISGDYDE